MSMFTTLAPQLGPMFWHFMALSLLSIGGAISTAPEMHRYLVGQEHWISDTQFTNSIALAQAAPGPNLLFVALLGWNVAGLPGAAAALAGIVLPSTTLVLAATRWASNYKDTRGVRSFTLGMAPLTLGLVLATGWLLAEPYLRVPQHRWAMVGMIALTVLLTLKTRLSLVWMVLGGGVLGAIGWV